MGMEMEMEMEMWKWKWGRSQYKAIFAIRAVLS